MLNTGRSVEVARTRTTRWSFENAGTVVLVSTEKSHPMVPTAASPAHACLATRTPGTSPIVTRLRATLNSCTSLLLKAVLYLTTVHESPGGIGKYQFWNFASIRSGGTPALPMRSSVTLSPSALRNRTVMNQSRTNEFGFEKKIPVFAITFGRTSSGVTEYVSGRTSGLTVAVAIGAGVGVGWYAGASTLQPESTAARRAHVRRRRITSSLGSGREASGG